MSSTSKEQDLLKEISRLSGWINGHQSHSQTAPPYSRGSRGRGRGSYRGYRGRGRGSYRPRGRGAPYRGRGAPPYIAKPPRQPNKRKPKAQTFRNELCSLYTRKGVCGDYKNGKCPYIHDPTKVKICSQFIQKGSCTKPTCTYQHKIVKEQMPVCSYFLRGICTNDDCKFLHVKVNPNASVCPSFLKGYCAMGEKCKLKHTRECPIYQSQGYCKDYLNGKCALLHVEEGKKLSLNGKVRPSRKKKESIDTEETSNTPENGEDNDLYDLVPKFLDEESEESEELEESEGSERDDDDNDGNDDEESVDITEDHSASEESSASTAPLPSFLSF